MITKLAAFFWAKINRDGKANQPTYLLWARTNERTENVFLFIKWFPQDRRLLSYLRLAECVAPSKFVENRLIDDQKKFFIFCKKIWSNSRFFFCLFSSFPCDTIQINIDKSLDGVCLGLEPGWQDGRCRRIHWATATPLNFSFLLSHLRLTFQFQ